MARRSNRGWQYNWKLTRERALMRFVDVQFPGAFANEWLQITPLPGQSRTLIEVAKGYSWDGCSIVPDAPGTHDASCVHDALYQFKDDLCRSWNLDWPDLRRLADMAFRDIMRRDKSPVSGLYYIGVRLFGGVFTALTGGKGD